MVTVVAMVKSMMLKPMMMEFLVVIAMMFKTMMLKAVVMVVFGKS